MTVSRDDLEALIAEVRREVSDPRGGIYGPGSQAWTISKEWALFLAGGRAVLLQLAHPYVAHGVDQHSNTREDPLGRFQRTFDRVFAIVFGDFDAAVRAARRVHRIHATVQGHIDEDVGAFRRGADYQANDPAALFWVHATLVDSAIVAYELCVRPLSFDEKDAYYRETKRFARLFGVPRESMPEGYADFVAYMERMLESDVLEVGEPARSIAKFLFSSPSPAHRPLFRWARVITAGMMPDRLRREFGLPYGPTEQRIYEWSFRAIRTVYPRLPRRLRYSPAYVRARRRLAGKRGPDRVGLWLERLFTRSLDTRRSEARDQAATRATLTR